MNSLVCQHCGYEFEPNDMLSSTLNTSTGGVRVECPVCLNIGEYTIEQVHAAGLSTTGNRV